MSPRTGRPVSDNPHSRVIPIRLTEDQYALIEEAAERAGTRAGVWIREKAVAAAKRAK